GSAAKTYRTYAVVRPIPERVPQARVQALRPAPAPGPAALDPQGNDPVPVCPLSCPRTPMPVPQAHTDALQRPLRRAAGGLECPFRRGRAREGSVSLSPSSTL